MAALKYREGLGSAVEFVHLFPHNHRPDRKNMTRGGKMQITKDKFATFDFTITDENGDLLDDSSKSGPVSYVHGVGFLIPGLEFALEGKSSGDSFKVTVSPSEGYGERDEALFMDVPKERLAGLDGLEEGILVQVGTPDGMQIMRVAEMTDEVVTLDGNHPLAGTALNFTVSVIDVRDATEEELGQFQSMINCCSAGCDCEEESHHHGGCDCGCDC